MAEYVMGQTLRVLLVSVQGEARAEVEKALAGWGSNHQLFWVSQSDMASTRAQELVPHVILIDDELGRTNPVQVVKELTTEIPSAQVVALVGEGSMSLAGQVVLAGARAFVGKPLQADELLAILRQVVAPHHTQPSKLEDTERTEGHIIVFNAPKGGTGRTTLALNTAVSLTMTTKQPVGLVDADYTAPALDVALNLHSERNISDLLTRFSRLDEELISAVMAPHASGIRVLLAPTATAYTESLTLPQVQHILVLLRSMFPWVVVDLGPPLNDMAFAFLDSADRIVITTLPDLVALRNTRILLDQLQGRGYGADKVFLVLNRSTMRGVVGRNDIEDQLQMQLTHTIPDDQPLATHSINRGVPFVMSHSRSALGRAVVKLAGQLVDDFAVERAVEPSERGARRWLPSPRPAST
ncbi:CpaE family protein [Chloroflexota bacterium]